MHGRNSWADLNGEKHKGKCPRSYSAFLECLELLKLTVFSTEGAERQRYYIQQGIRKPQRATVHQFVSRVEVLNGYLKHLPTLKDSPKAVATTKKGNVPFKEADLASIILAALPLTWQNQYNLTHSTVPKSPRTLLADLENIERIVLERYSKKQRLKDEAGTAHPEKSKPKKVHQNRAHLIESQRRREARSFASVARLMVEPIRLTTQLNVAVGTKMVSPLDSLELSHPINIRLTRKTGVKKGWPT
jgi:hypothetical protein